MWAWNSVSNKRKRKRRASFFVFRAVRVLLPSAVVLVLGDGAGTWPCGRGRVSLSQWISGSVVEGAPTEEPRPDANNARRQRPATSAKLARPVLLPVC
jgi:hypothetical protein